VPAKPDEHSAEIARLSELLKAVIKMSEVPTAEIERRIGQSPGYIWRLLSGSFELKLRRVLEILQAIELRPTEFFNLAYPPESAPASPTGRKLQVFNPKAHAPQPEPPAATSQELQRFLAEIRDLVSHQAATRGTAGEPVKSRRR
jgi:transcriptional regulator with XRE-family HTH domain